MKRTAMKRDLGLGGAPDLGLGGAALQCLRESIFRRNSGDKTFVGSSPGGASELSPALQRGVVSKKSAKSRRGDPVATQALQWVRENSVVPPGLISLVPLFPPLKRWAKLGRPSGAGAQCRLSAGRSSKVDKVPNERPSSHACTSPPAVALVFSACLLICSLGCSRPSATSASMPKPAAYGAALVESSGGKQPAEVGTQLAQPVVVQVNDEQGNAVTGALVVVRGPNGTYLDPAAGLTDSSGQFTTNVSLGTIAGRYQLVASTTTKAGKNVDLKIEEIGLGYQEMLGSQLNDQYCARCHNQESTPQRVSNYDNLEVKPHPFTEGETLNKMSDADPTAIISHGGPALNKSPLMPPYGYTLSKSEIQALIAYIRMVSDPPYGAPGIVYAQK